MMFGDKLWSRQREIIRSTLTHPRIAVKAAHGVGKTFLAARIANYHMVHASDGAMLVTTAPTFRQVQDLLWREMRRAYRASVYRGTPIAPQGPASRGPRWVIDPEEPENRLCFGVASANPDNLQGYHDRQIIAIIDEAASVEDWVWEQLLSFKPTLLLAIGNPTDPESQFARCFDSERWQCHTIKAFDAPNLTGEWSKLWSGPNPALVDQDWIDEVRERFGEDSPYWKSRVLAEFPSEGADALIPSNMYEAARMASPSPCRWRAFGVDLAELGGDQSIVTVWDEHVLSQIIALPPADLMETCGRIAVLARDLAPDTIAVDDTGLVGVASRLREISREQSWKGTHGEATRIMPIVPGSGCTTDEAKTRYLNLRAEMAWELREGLRSREAGIGVDSPRLHEEGRKSHYTVSSSGKIQLEPKDDIRERIHRSPDSLDAAMYGWHAARDLAKRFAPGRYRVAAPNQPTLPEEFRPKGPSGIRGRLFG